MNTLVLNRSTEEISESKFIKIVKKKIIGGIENLKIKMYHLSHFVALVIFGSIAFTAAMDSEPIDPSRRARVSFDTNENTILAPPATSGYQSRRPSHVTLNENNNVGLGLGLESNDNNERIEESSTTWRAPPRTPGAAITAAGEEYRRNACAAGATTTTPRSATFSESARSIVNTPGVLPRNTHLERFDGQFIQPRFQRQIYKDLAIAASEFQGTLLFLLIAFLGSNPTATVNEVAYSYATGLLSTITMHSSSQSNPSISVIQAALGKLTPRQAVMNIGAQISASIAASGIQTLMVGDTWSVAELTVSPARGLLVETALSTVLFTAVLWVSAMPSVQKATMPFLISLIFLGCELSGIRLTSAALNSARQLGPAIVSGRWHNYDYIYHINHLIAVPLSLFIFKANQLLQAPDARPSDVGPGRIVDVRRRERSENDIVDV